jgi:5-methylcytosine-specific restriction endonuclease McrA
MKTCTHINCQEVNPQPLNNFANNSKTKDGKTTYCKKCMVRENNNRKKLKEELKILKESNNIDDFNTTLSCFYINDPNNNINKLLRFFEITLIDLIHILQSENLYEYKVCIQCNRLKHFSEYFFKNKSKNIYQQKCKTCVCKNNSNSETVKNYRKQLNQSPVKFDVFDHQINFMENTRRALDDFNILEVTCAYCGRWFKPTLQDIYGRISAANNINHGERRLYCTEKCKTVCPTYRKQLYDTNTTTNKKQSLNREVQAELRQLVLKRDNYTCQKCQMTQDELEVGLHCHHIEGIQWSPIESADIDMCITLCKNCHKKVHSIEGCKYVDMQCK